MTSQTRLRDVLRNDLRQPDFRKRVQREFKDLWEAMIAEDQNLSLKQRWFPVRWVLGSWWLIKGMFLRLTPTRRLLLLAGLILLLLRVQIEGERSSADGNFLWLGLLLILFVLMLELKDKLLAKHELEDGHAIQRALAPERTPAVPGWQLWLFTRPANEVGGDLVDIIHIGGDRYGLALGDVAGKGLGAALLMAKLQATLRALATETGSMGDIVRRVNSIFWRDSPRQMFASLLFAEISTGGDSVRMINAGHIPPLVVRGSGIMRLEKGGPALGLLESPSFIEQAIELTTGEFVLIYSDGLSETRNGAGDFFGDERLFTLLTPGLALSAQELGDRLVASVDRFQGDARTHDDLSLIIIRRA